MLTNRILPQWLHGVAGGLLTSSFAVTLASAGLRDSDPASWVHSAASVLLWSAVPIGLVVAAFTHRFSIVEGCAGEVGYEDLPSQRTQDRLPSKEAE